MRYPQLSEIGQHYAAEEGTPGKRLYAFAYREAELKKALLALNTELARVRNARPLPKLPNAPSARPSVKALAAHHQGKILEASNDTLAKLQRAVQHQKRWITMQGLRLTAEGSVDFSVDRATVVYDHDLAQQGMTRLRFQGGRAYLDDQYRVPLTTAGMVTHFSGPGWAIYVMSQQGNIHISSHSVGHRHHSSLLAGGNVAGAGELRAVDGRITFLTNKSGHYCPNPDHLIQVLHQLDKAGIAMSFPLKVIMAPPAPPKRYPSVGAFLADWRLDGKPDYEMTKLLAYSQHLTDDVLGLNGWRWDPLAEGVCEIVGGAAVAPRTVRRWLKSVGRQMSDEVQSGARR